ncbi:hypothetical protein D3C78_1702790 [compost metagenome]
MLLSRETPVNLQEEDESQAARSTYEHPFHLEAGLSSRISIEAQLHLLSPVHRSE